MTHLLWRRRMIVFMSLVLWCTVLATAGVTAGQFGWLPGVDKDVKYTTYKDPSGRFELEYPTKDWRILPPGGSSLAVFSRSDGPSLFIDQSTLKAPLTNAEVDAMLDIELSSVKEQWPKGKGFDSQILESKSGRGVLVRYSRPGSANQEEAVVQYSVPVDRNLYRLNGVVPQKLVSKHQATVMHMMQSFKAPANSTTTKD